MGRPRLVKRATASPVPTLDDTDVLTPSPPTTAQKIQPKVQESIADAYLRALNDNASLFKDQLASSLITSAIKGDTTALKEINDRILGKNNAEVSDKEDYTLISDDRVVEIFQAWQDTKAYFKEINTPTQ